MHYQYTDNLSEEEFEEELGEMVHFSKKYSKLPYRILMDYDGKNRKRKDNSPRIMISLDNHCRNIIPISIDKENPDILINKEVPKFEMIKNFIINHYEILMKHWNQEIDDLSLLRFLIKKE